MPKPKVRIRMYRPGLGDCFLLSFGSGAKRSHILIDCGIFVGTQNEKARTTAIAENVLLETGQRVSALVATHEHWDHVAGFFHAQPVFDRLQAGEVWLAWTEDPHQTIARENKKQIAEAVKTVGVAVERLRAAPSVMDRECGFAMAEVLGFEGIGGEALFAAAFSKRTDEAMDWVHSKKPESQPYLRPGDVLERDWLPGVRVYVLGPPMDLAALRQMSGSEEEGYESKRHGAAFGWMAAVVNSARPGEFDVETTEAAERLRPFDSNLGWPESSALELSRRFGPLYDSYEKQQWRKIDNDWLLAGARLALQVDNAINNTSLVLAFELVDSGDVLLFVGDAQAGNWRSWIDREFSVNEGKNKRKVTGRELLARTVFYKVGHHGSGNATLRPALEAMVSDRLVAAIPTDEAFASEKKGWEMPAPRLIVALHEKTKGRILRADPNRNVIPQERPAEITREAWDRFARAVTREDPLFVDYEL